MRSLARLLLLLAGMVLSVDPDTARSQDLNCYFISDSRDNNWKQLAECEQNRAKAAVALMLVGVNHDTALETSLEYQRKYKFHVTTGERLSADPVAWVHALPDCLRQKAELRTCAADFHYRPDDGSEIPAAEMQRMLADWTDCRFWRDCPTVGAAFDAEAVALEKANYKKFDRIVAKAQKSATRKCKAIAKELSALEPLKAQCAPRMF